MRLISDQTLVALLHRRLDELGEFSLFAMRLGPRQLVHVAVRAWDARGRAVRLARQGSELGETLLALFDDLRALKVAPVAARSRGRVARAALRLARQRSVTVEMLAKSARCTRETATRVLHGLSTSRILDADGTNNVIRFVPGPAFELEVDESHIGITDTSVETDGVAIVDEPAAPAELELTQATRSEA